jgi:hypothetical protein
MSAADGFMTPAPGAAHAELEQRYRRLLRPYPREFRARRADEMLGVLMASAGKGQSRPEGSDVSDILRGSLVVRLRGLRGGWPFTLAAFALGPVSPAAAHTGIVAVLFLPPLLVLCWAVAQAIRTGRTRDPGDLAA